MKKIATFLLYMVQVCSKKNVEGCLKNSTFIFSL
jgi:hypothetical protein